MNYNFSNHFITRMSHSYKARIYGYLGNLHNHQTPHNRPSSHFHTSKHSHTIYLWCPQQIAVNIKRVSIPENRKQTQNICFMVLCPENYTLFFYEFKNLYMHTLFAMATIFPFARVYKFVWGTVFLGHLTFSPSYHRPPPPSHNTTRRPLPSAVARVKFLGTQFIFWATKHRRRRRRRRKTERKESTREMGINWCASSTRNLLFRIYLSVGICICLCVCRNEANIDRCKARGYLN